MFKIYWSIDQLWKVSVRSTHLYRGGGHFLYTDVPAGMGKRLHLSNTSIWLGYIQFLSYTILSKIYYLHALISASVN
jgi:hypothetical protein